MAQHLARLHQAADHDGGHDLADPWTGGPTPHQRRLHPRGIRGQSPQPDPGQWRGQPQLQRWPPATAASRGPDHGLRAASDGSGTASVSILLATGQLLSRSGVHFQTS